MDGRSFDQWTPAIASGASHRALLKGLSGGLLSGLIGVDVPGSARAAGCRERGTRCRTGTRLCNDGACHACCDNGDCTGVNSICSGGSCICHGSGQSCTPGGSPTGCCSGRACNPATNTCCTAANQECVDNLECCPGTGCSRDGDFIKRCH